MKAQLAAMLPLEAPPSLVMVQFQGVSESTAVYIREESVRFSNL